MLRNILQMYMKTNTYADYKNLCATKNYLSIGSERCHIDLHLEFYHEWSTLLGIKLRYTFGGTAVSSRNSVAFEVSFSSFGHVSDSSSGVRVRGSRVGVSGFRGLFL